MVYYLTAAHNFKASVQITASHNPKEYNGLKVSRENAIPVGYDTGLNLVEKMMNEEEVVISENRGQIINFDHRQEYLDFLKSYAQDISNLNVSVDCSNGMASLLVKDIWGEDISYIYDEIDGTFPNHEPNPLEEENVEDLKKLVLENSSDVGVIFDGDADRVMFVDEKANFIRPDLMIAVMAKYFLKGENKNATVIQDIRTSKSVSEYVESLGGKVHMWRVGRAFAAIRLREIDGLFGGELAGHYYFKDFFYSDSGILAAIIMLNIISELKKEGKTLSQLISEIDTYSNSGEINFKLEKKQEAIDAVVKHFTKDEKPSAIFDFDGYRVEFRDWWFNIRPSNTEPYLRLIAEAKSDEILNKNLSEIKNIIAKFAD
jgi:phosphomannomutase